MHRRRLLTLASLIAACGLLCGFFHPAMRGVVNVAPSGDDFDLLIIPCDGSDEATTFTDIADSGTSNPYTVTAYNGASTETSTYQYGTASLELDGTDDHITVTDSADWAFGTNDFTIEFWCRMNSVAASWRMWTQWQNGDNRQGFQWSQSISSLSYYVKAGGAATHNLTASWSPSVDTWYHVALVRSGNTWYMFADGVDLTSGGITDADSVGDFSATVDFGRYGGSSSFAYSAGYIDDIRISSYARYTTAFTPTGPHAP